MTDARPTRADAQNNRDRILSAAVVLFAEDQHTSLAAIGKRAGVGQGTLYRHFRDRDALVWALYEREVDELVGYADDLLSSEDPSRAIRTWMSSLHRFARTKAGLGEAMNKPIVAETSSAHAGYARISLATGRLLEAARAAGSIRADVTVDDFNDLVSGLWRIAAQPGEEGRAERFLDLVFAAVSVDPTPGTTTRA